MAKRKKPPVHNLVVVSDLHVGCQLGLCHPDGFQFDEGGVYLPNKLQKAVWAWWEEFWGEVVPDYCRGEPFAVCLNGDALDGSHHGATHQWTHNLTDQGKAALRILEPVVQACEGRYYHIRGTEAHVGPSSAQEEQLAASLKAIPNENGQYARYELWLRIGRGLAHLSHHIGTAGSMHYESTAPMRELTEAYVEAGRWHQEPPDWVVRCLAEDTEVLTPDGWKGRDAITEESVVLTMHPLTEEMQWQRVLEKTENANEPTMIHITGKGMDIMVTPDHNLLLRKQWLNGWKRDQGAVGGWYFEQAQTVFDDLADGRNRNGSSLREIPVSGWYEGRCVPLSDDELWLLGFFMADGSWVQRDGHIYAMRVHQADVRANEIEERLRGAGIMKWHKGRNAVANTPHFDSRKSRYIYTRQDCSTWYIPAESAARFIPWLNADKSLTARLLDVTADEFAALLAGFAYGDGSRTGHKLHNANRRILDQFQELMVKHGYKSNLSMQQAYTTKRGERRTVYVLHFLPGRRAVSTSQKRDGATLELITDYGKATWCVRVPNATLVTRRNGCVAIVGNSHRHRNVEVRVQTHKGFAICCTTPAWQLKMLDLNTPLPTPGGWTTMGNVTVGDTLFDEQGNPCSVLAAHPINLRPDSYEVRFSNGECVKACADHLWLTTVSVDRPGIPGHGGETRPLTRVRTTREIAETLLYGKDNRRNHKLDMPLPLATPEKPLPIDPYVLGCWLGDGDSDSARLTCHIKDAWHYGDEFWKSGYRLTAQSQPAGKCPRFAIRAWDAATNEVVTKDDPRNLQRVLREHCLLGNKHIPSAYLRGSVAQRLSLLQGLMDTDGHPDHLGRACFYTTTLRQLCEGMEELLAGLGIKYTVVERPALLYGKEVGRFWLFRFFVSPDIMPVFRLPRKLERVALASSRKTAQKSRVVHIVACEPCDPVPMRCIAVDSPSSLYRFGKTMLYTHNTPFAYRIAGARQSTPQIGGTVLRCGDEDLYTRHKVWALARPKEESL